MALTNKEIKDVKKLEALNFDVDYSEQDLRELVGLETNDKNRKIDWFDVVGYVFCWFNKFSTEFKREARENSIKEYAVNNHVSEQEARKFVDEDIADAMITFLVRSFHFTDTLEERYKVLQQIKEGQFKEFINVDDLLPFS